MYLGELEASRSLPGANSGGFWALGMDWFSGMVANLERDGAAAVPFFASTLRRVERMPETSFQILALTDLCAAHLLAGDAEEALEVSRRAVDLLSARERRAIGAGFSPAHVWWWRHQALAAHGATKEAHRALQNAFALLLEGIGTLSDEGLRRSYLNKIDSHRAIVRAWIEHARARRLPAKRLAAHLAGQADLRAPFERLVDTGMRMNELRSAADLHEFLVDEVTELSGAERVLLVVDMPSGPHIAGSLLPAGEDAAALLRSITSMADETRRTRAASLRHEPATAAPIDQRSIVIAPLIVQQRLIGYLYTDIDGAFGRFHDADRDLLSMLAAQAAVALDNAQWSQGLEAKVAARTSELSASNAMLEQALEQKTATGEVLQAISASVADASPVFDAIVRNAVRLCDGMFANVVLFDGEMLHLTATSNSEPEFLKLMHSRYPMPPDATQISGRVILGKAVVVMEDALTDPEYAHSLAIAGRWRRMLGVPLLREGNPLGVITVGWDQPGPILKVHEELLKTFADQAVIAIENVRLFNETNQALDRQTATADILRVISKSPTDVQPVFHAVAERAGQLCHADLSRVWLVSGNELRAMTTYGPGYPADSRSETLPLRKTSVGGRCALERRVIHVEDIVPLIDTEYPDVREITARYGFRTVLNVPLLRDGETIGVISVLRNTMRPFAAEEIALVQTFADQAVIAIENVRLFNETKEALERQTATTEVLKVISESPTDVQPVFDIIAERAARLTGAQYGLVFRFDGEMDSRRELVRHRVGRRRGPAAPLSDAGRRAGDLRAGNPKRRGDQRRRPAGRIGRRLPALDEGIRPQGRLSQRDERADAARPACHRRHQRESRRARAVRRQGGRICCRPSPSQAVIAIENVRLFNETKEALEQQTATAEVLQVISSSVADTTPVFGKILDSCQRLFTSEQLGIFLVDDDDHVKRGANGAARHSRRCASTRRCRWKDRSPARRSASAARSR